MPPRQSGTAWTRHNQSKDGTRDRHAAVPIRAAQVTNGAGTILKLSQLRTSTLAKTDTNLRKARDHG
jgi:hypothetical protein